MDRKKVLEDTAKSFEVLISLKNEQSVRVAWRVASIAIALSFLSVGALWFVLPLKKTEIAVVRVDNITGRTELLNSATHENIPQQVALEKYFTSLYVKLRERYNYYSSQVDYDTVPIYSAEPVSNDYVDLWAGDSAPDKIYQGPNHVATIDIISNIISDSSPPDKVATVRFAKHIRNVVNNTAVVEYFVARVTFRMITPQNTSTEIRLNNPLGFTVVEYLLEKEMRPLP